MSLRSPYLCACHKLQTISGDVSRNTDGGDFSPVNGDKFVEGQSCGRNRIQSCKIEGRKARKVQENFLNGKREVCKGDTRTLKEKSFRESEKILKGGFENS